VNEGRRATLAYVLPFATYAGLMAAERALGLAPEFAYPVRILAAGIVLLVVSRPFINLRPSFPLASIGIGIAVFAIWIGPDLLLGPGYRHLAIFENGITGRGAATLPDTLRQSVLFLAVRSFGSIVVVPLLEELFWRGWMMRWIINPDFQKVPLGQYGAAAFWIVAVLFASEHGAYWDVGLAAGILYNWWVVRTRNLADCMLAHAVTNGLLAVWVIGRGQWQYWL